MNEQQWKALAASLRAQFRAANVDVTPDAYARAEREANEICDGAAEPGLWLAVFSAKKYEYAIAEGFPKGGVTMGYDW